MTDTIRRADDDPADRLRATDDARDATHCDRCGAPCSPAFGRCRPCIEKGDDPPMT